MKSWIANLKSRLGLRLIVPHSDDRDGGLIRGLRFREGHAGPGGDAGSDHNRPR